MNINEFDRTKPRLTFRKIQGAIFKYEKLRDDCVPPLDENSIDGSSGALNFHDLYSIIVKDLKSIQKSFLKGE
jgi:hypothetical protein